MNEASSIQEWNERFQSALPEGWRKGFSEAKEWVEKNPSKAAMIGAAAGFSLGFVGVRRIWKGLEYARRTPLFAGLAFQAASGLSNALNRKNPNAPEDRL